MDGWTNVEEASLEKYSMTSPVSVPGYLREDDVSSEVRDLFSRLPRERGWLVNYIYQYQGFWASPTHLQGVVSCQNHFHAHHSDIILASNPKTGTTWLKALSFALINRSQFHHHHPLLTTNPHELVPFLELKLYRGRDLPDLSHFTSPRLFATHIPFASLPTSVNDSSCKIVYISRNPMDTFVSLCHFANKLSHREGGDANNLEELFDKFCRGVSVFGPFWDHVLGYWNEGLKSPHKILFLKYEEIKEQPAAQLRRLAEFLNCPFSHEEESEGVVDQVLRLCSFDNLSNLDVNKSGRLDTGEPHQAFYRKGEVGGWEKVLTTEMVERLNTITKEKMYDSGFKF